jgi:pimeloyl-ACP methyl ester carboxylesterase
MTRRIVFFLLLIVFGGPAWADLAFIRQPEGDYYLYEPSKPAGHVLVLAHGTRPKSDTAQEWALENLKPWLDFADQQGLLLIAPVFDDARFGNRTGGYGGYRGLFGKLVPADRFVIDLARRHAVSSDARFLMYGHSAGGQFAVRFVVRHPDLVNFALAGAPGRFSYPTKEARWPYGAGALNRTIEWADGRRQQVRVTGDLRAYARAAGRIHVLVGSEDLKPQPERPAHKGRTRVALAQSWTEAMNRHAKRFGRSDTVALTVLPGLGHRFGPLAEAAQSILRQKLSDLR